MFCKSYERKLRDAALSGEELPDALRRHLGECGPCASAWPEELALLAAIDVDLRRTVNVEAPASLAALVRQRVAELPPQGFRPRLWIIPAAVGAMAIGLFFLRTPGPPTRENIEQVAVGPIVARNPVISNSADHNGSRTSIPQPIAAGKAVPRRAESGNAAFSESAKPMLLPGTAEATAQLVALLNKDPELAEKVADRAMRTELTLRPIEVAGLELAPISIQALRDAHDEPTR